MHQWGKQIKFLRQIEADTGVTPPRLADAPWLEGEVLGKYQIFSEIARSRALSMGGPLPISDANIIDYLTLHQIPKCEWDYVAEYVKLYDDVWFEHQEEVKPPPPAPKPNK